MSKPVVQIIGLQRSGTNWVGGLISANFVADVLHRGKHKLPGHQQESDYTVVVAKRLDHWLNSIKRFPATLEKMHPELYPGGVLDMKASVDLYYKFYEAWGVEVDGCIWRYDKVLELPEEHIRIFGHKYGLTLQSNREREFYTGGPQWDKMPPAKVNYYLSRGDFAYQQRPF